MRVDSIPKVPLRNQVPSHNQVPLHSEAHSNNQAPPRNQAPSHNQLPARYFLCNIARKIIKPKYEKRIAVLIRLYYSLVSSLYFSAYRCLAHIKYVIPNLFQPVYQIQVHKSFLARIKSTLEPLVMLIDRNIAIPID